MKIMILPLAAVGVLGISLVTAWVVFHRPGEGRALSRKQGIPEMTIMAHRGVSDLAPEATDPSYRLALELGADYLEADIQRTADGVLVCFHDDTLKRTTDVAQVFPGRENDNLDKFTYAELITLDAGSWFNDKNPARGRDSFHELKILTLDELIDIAESGANRPGLYLETKSAHRYPGIEQQILDALRSRGWVEPAEPTISDANEPGSDAVDFDGAPANEETADRSDALVAIADGPARVILQSFEEESLQSMKRLAPKIPRVYLVDEDAEKKKGGWDQLVAIARRNGALLGPSGYQAWPWKISAAHQNGVLVHHYTINKGWQMRLIRWVGSDGIFTNRADLALDIYRNRRLPDIEAEFRRLGY